MTWMVLLIFSAVAVAESVLLVQDYITSSYAPRFCSFVLLKVGQLVKNFRESDSPPPLPTPPPSSWKKIARTPMTERKYKNEIPLLKSYNNP